MAGPLLEYETEMFLSLFSTDGLLIAAEGLGIDRILLHFMKVYSEEGSLVLLLNTTTPEQVTVQQIWGKSLVYYNYYYYFYQQ